jgi:hypothetical protein
MDASEKRLLINERRWEHGWNEHEARQRLRMAQLSLSEKLVWLEQAQQTVNHLQKSRLLLREADASQRSK